jgi:hypothetical protein
MDSMVALAFWVTQPIWQMNEYSKPHSMVCCQHEFLGPKLLFLKLNLRKLYMLLMFQAVLVIHGMQLSWILVGLLCSRVGGVGCHILWERGMLALISLPRVVRSSLMIELGYASFTLWSFEPFFLETLVFVSSSPQSLSLFVFCVP